MPTFEQTDFSGGLVNKIAAHELEVKQLQKSKSCDHSKPGILKSKKGWEDLLSSDLPNNVDDIFYQNVFSASGLIVRAGNTLYEVTQAGVTRPFEWDVAEAENSYLEYNSWLIICDGNENRKYKQSGATISFHVGVCYPWEYTYKVNTALANPGTSEPCALALWLRQATVSHVATYWCCYDWEKDKQEGGTGAESDSYAGSYTTTTDLDQAFSAPAPDPDVKLLLNMDGAAGATQISDASASNHTITFNGDAHIDTNQKKHGTASLRLDGTGDYLSVADHADWFMGSGAFSIDFFFRIASHAGLGEAFDILGKPRIDANDSWYIRFYGYGSGEYDLRLLGYNSGTSATQSDFSERFNLNENQWYHFALVRGHSDDTARYRWAIDGTFLSTNYDPQDWSWDMPDNADDFVIGGNVVGDLDYFNGWIDEVRVVKGKTLWTSDFTPPGESIDLSPTSITSRPWPYPVKLGIAAPDSSNMVATEGVAGNLGAGTYKYKVTYLNTDSFESNASALTSVVIGASKKSELTYIPVSDDPQVTSRKVYRTQAGGGTYYLLTTLSDNHTESYSDNIADGSLSSTELDTQDHDQPGAALFAAEYQSVLFLLISPNQLWWCNAFDEWEYFGAFNFEQIGSTGRTGRGLGALGDKLAIILDTEIWNWEGTDNVTFAKSISLSNRGAVSQKSIKSRGDIIYFVDGAGIFMYDQVRDIGGSIPVDGLFNQEWSDSDLVNRDQFLKIVLAYLDGELLVSYPHGSELANSRLLRYDVLTKSFDLIETGFMDLTIDPEKKQIYSSSGAMIYKMWSSLFQGDGATEVAFQAQTKDFAKEIGGLTQLKKIEWVKFDCDPNTGQIDVVLYIDGVSAGSWSYSTDTRAVIRKRADVAKNGRRIMFDIQGTNDAEFYGLAANIEPKEGP